MDIQERINHSTEFVSADNNEIHTNNIERLWRDMRPNIPSGITKKYLENHLKQYMVMKNFNFEIFCINRFILNKINIYRVIN